MNMKKYAVTIRAGKSIEDAIGQEIYTTFELHAINERAAQNRATKMMSFIVEGYIEEKGLNPALADDGFMVIACKATEE